MFWFLGCRRAQGPASKIQLKSLCQWKGHSTLHASTSFKTFVAHLLFKKLLGEIGAYAKLNLVLPADYPTSKLDLSRFSKGLEISNVRLGMLSGVSREIGRSITFAI
jgi:hypothetical protein